MACTTILVGKKASYDGSTMIARNDDSGSGHFTPKKFVVVHPDEQPKTYKSVISHVTIELPDDPMRYTAVPNAVEGEGIWAAAGVNEANVAMTATETITSNPRVLGADPLVEIQPAEDGKEEVPGGIGEEDIVCIVLPYIRSAREGVKRLGSLLEQYGTYEMNGIAFQDQRSGGLRRSADITGLQEGCRMMYMLSCQTSLALTTLILRMRYLIRKNICVLRI